MSDTGQQQSQNPPGSGAESAPPPSRGGSPLKGAASVRGGAGALMAAPAGMDLGSFNVLKDVEVEITLEIGRRNMRIADVLRLTTGQTVELSKAAGEPIEIYVNGQLLGRGEAVVVGDRYGVRITELIKQGGDG
jgi:flagellar motor switch protein FliN/FliY